MIRHLLPALLATATLTGCLSHPPSLPAIGNPGAELNVQSSFYGDVHLNGDFDSAIYGYDSQDHFTAVLLAGPIDNPRQAVTLRFFWRPRPAQTPIDADATNCTFHYLVFEPEQDKPAVGVYSGAGYVFLHQKPGAKRISGDVWQAILSLTDASTGFDDRLGEARMRGSILLRRDDAAITDYMRRLSRMVTDRLGYPRLVRHGHAEDALVTADDADR